MAAGSARMRKLAEALETKKVVVAEATTMEEMVEQLLSLPENLRNLVLAKATPEELEAWNNR